MTKKVIKTKVFLAKIISVFLMIWCCQSNAIISTHDKPFYVSGLKPETLKLALNAYNNAKAAGLGPKDVLTIVDYSLPSTERRLWVIDMQTKQVLFNTHVAHGIGSGTNYATRFSNQHGSKMSSIGLFVTSGLYHGKYGKSLNLVGLENEFNSNAEARRIVFHEAHYVDEAIIKKIGRLGRSFGCLALSRNEAHKIMEVIKDGSLVFCYYPDSKWLRKSKFLW